MKWILFLCFVISSVAAQLNFTQILSQRPENADQEGEQDGGNWTALLEVFGSMTEKFRGVYSHQLELLRTNKTTNRILVRFVDAEEDTDDEEDSLNPFFKWLGDLKETKFQKLSNLRNKGFEKMKGKLENWNMSGIQQKFYGAQTGLNVLEIDSEIDMSTVWQTILLDQDVEFCELDMTVNLTRDCREGSDWGYRHTRAEHASDILSLQSQSSADNDSQVLVAVIDSGVDYNHPLLQGRVWINEAERDGVPGVDDDGNGYTDDIWGWNFASGTNDVQDADGHGTHVAGIIAASHTVDPDEFSGAAPNVMILPCRFTENSDSGSVSAAIQCIEYAFEMGADILSNSWGGVGAYSLALEEAMNRASRRGRLQIAAAGNTAADNDGGQDQATYPAAYDTDIIIAVAAINVDGELTQISNFGANSVDIGAPGESIVSTEADGSLTRMSGTSQATPYVSAAAALLLGACRAQGRSCSALDIKNAIIEGAVQVSSLEGLVLASGYLDIPNAARVLNLANLTSLDERNDNELDVCRGARIHFWNGLLMVCLLMWFLVL